MISNKAYHPCSHKLEHDNAECYFLASHLTVNGSNGSRTGHIQQTEHHQRIGVCSAESHGAKQRRQLFHACPAGNIIHAEKHAAA